MVEGKNCLMRNLSNENTAILQLHFIVIFHFLFVEIFDKDIHLVLGLCVFSFLGKTAYCENRIYGEKKSPKFFNIFCSLLMRINQEPYVLI